MINRTMFRTAEDVVIIVPISHRFYPEDSFVGGVPVGQFGQRFRYFGEDIIAEMRLCYTKPSGGSATIAGTAGAAHYKFTIPAADFDSGNWHWWAFPYDFVGEAFLPLNSGWNLQSGSFLWGGTFEALCSAVENIAGLATASSLSALVSQLGTPAGASIAADIAAARSTLGSPAGGSVAAAVAAVKADTAGISAKASASDLSDLSAKIGNPTTETIADDLVQVKASADSAETKANDVKESGMWILRILSNRTRFNTATRRLELYAENGTDLLGYWPMLDAAGAPAAELGQVYERGAPVFGS